MSLDYPLFRAEQAVKKRIGDRHTPWRWIDDGRAAQTLDQDVLAAYKDALVDAYRKLDEVNEKYRRDHELNKKWKQERDAEAAQAMRYRETLLIERYGAASKAVAVVQAASRAGRKTVRVDDVLAALGRWSA